MFNGNLKNVSMLIYKFSTEHMELEKVFLEKKIVAVSFFIFLQLC